MSTKTETKPETATLKQAEAVRDKIQNFLYGIERRRQVIEREQRGLQFKLDALAHQDLFEALRILLLQNGQSVEECLAAAYYDDLLAEKLKAALFPAFKAGATDAEILGVLKKFYQHTHLSEYHPNRIVIRGGAKPIAWVDSVDEEHPTLAGAELVAACRRALKIPLPKKAEKASPAGATGKKPAVSKSPTAKSPSAKSPARSGKPAQTLGQYVASVRRSLGAIGNGLANDDADVKSYYNLRIAPAEAAKKIREKISPQNTQANAEGSSKTEKGGSSAPRTSAPSAVKSAKPSDPKRLPLKVGDGIATDALSPGYRVTEVIPRTNGFFDLKLKNAKGDPATLVGVHMAHGLIQLNDSAEPIINLGQEGEDDGDGFDDDAVKDDTVALIASSPGLLSLKVGQRRGGQWAWRGHMTLGISCNGYPWSGRHAARDAAIAAALETIEARVPGMTATGGSKAKKHAKVISGVLEKSKAAMDQNESAPEPEDDADGEYVPTDEEDALAGAGV